MDSYMHGRAGSAGTPTDRALGFLCWVCIASYPLTFFVLEMSDIALHVYSVRASKDIPLSLSHMWVEG